MATLTMIEREAEYQQARRHQETVPQWVNSLTEESSAWEFLKPKEKKKKKRKLTQEEFPDDDDHVLVPRPHAWRPPAD